MSFTYDGLEFKTELEAQWAAFFDLAGWQWQRGPIPVDNWAPDFRVKFTCSHSECNGSHTILVAVLPVETIESVKGHPALAHTYLVKDNKGAYLADAGAIFGANPSVTYWEMGHGAGGGIENVTSWVDEVYSLWTQAGQRVLTKA